MRTKVAALATLAFAVTLTVGYIFLVGDESVVPVVDARHEQSEGTTPPPLIEAREEPQSPAAWWAISVILLSLATVTSVAISFYLYRWRRILLAQPNLIVPEEWGKYLAGVGQGLKMLAGTVNTNLGLVSQETNRNSEQVSKLLETFLTLQKAIDERDEEVKRLKKGYDSHIYRRFLNRFIRVDQLISDYLQSSSGNQDNMAQVKRLLEDALDECGVEAFTPSIGEDSRVVDGIADNPKIVSADDKESEFKIVEVIEKGYRMRGKESNEILVPAKVSITMLDESREAG